MYSQNKEEQIILDYFSRVQPVSKTFLDIGANDGITLSNTRRLAELGWGGVCLEPSPNAYYRLEKNCSNFPNVYTYPYGIGKHNGEASLWESGALLGAHDIGLVSTMMPEEMERWKSANISFMETKVQFYRWRTFKNRIKFKYQAFDFISIDAEGADLMILEQIVKDQTIKPLVFCVEWNGKDKDKFVALLEDYRIIYTSGENLIFAL